MSWELNTLQTSDRHKWKRESIQRYLDYAQVQWKAGKEKHGLAAAWGKKRTNHLNREAYGLVFSGKHWKCNHLGQLKLNWTQTPENVQKESTASTVFWSCVELVFQISGVGLFCCCWLKDIKFHTWTATYSSFPPGHCLPRHQGVTVPVPQECDTPTPTVQYKRLQVDKWPCWNRLVVCFAENVLASTSNIFSKEGLC